MPPTYSHPRGGGAQAGGTQLVLVGLVGGRASQPGVWGFFSQYSSTDMPAAHAMHSDVSAAQHGASLGPGASVDPGTALSHWSVTFIPWTKKSAAHVHSFLR